MTKINNLQARLDALLQREEATQRAWRANDVPDYEESYLSRSEAISKQIGETKRLLEQAKRPKGTK